MARPPHIETAIDLFRELLAVEVPEGEFVARRDLSDEEARLKTATIEVLEHYIKTTPESPNKKKPAQNVRTPVHKSGVQQDT